MKQFGRKARTDAFLLLYLLVISRLRQLPLKADFSSCFTGECPRQNPCTSLHLEQVNTCESETQSIEKSELKYFLNNLLIIGSLAGPGQLTPNAVKSQGSNNLHILSPDEKGAASAMIDSMPMCQFTVPHMATESGEYLVLCGSIPELGR